MLGLVLRSRWVTRLSRGIPVARLLVLGEIALIARRHIVMLDRRDRRRLIALLARARGRSGRLTDGEHAELVGLIARLQPRQFLGSAIRRVSPVPLPKRLLYGPRGGAARQKAL
ncbi:MAG: hypothetical protein QOE28_2979, partial [Solirubrobacteraceae bacterium]|nr:hypothetical protein [Solirubrobacteraceae bacterium]